MMDLAQPDDGRRNRRKADRRAAIIAVAKRRFLERGYDGTSMSAIAEEMGGSKATLWSYFSSKEELFAEVIELAVASFKLALSDILKPDDDVRMTLQRLAEQYINRVSMPDAIALHRLIVSEVARQPELGRIFYDRAPGMTRLMVADFFRQQMDAGELRSSDATEAAGIFLDLCSSGYHQRIVWGIEELDARKVKVAANRAIEQFGRSYFLPDIA